MKYSAAKRHLQADVLGKALDAVGKKHMRVLCLPGRELWDVEFFSARPDVKEIIGLEWTREIFDQISGDPRAEILYELTTDYLLRCSGAFDIIFLDYMSTANLLVCQDVDIIFRRRLIRPGGFIVTNLFGSRKGFSSFATLMWSYRDFCEALGNSTPEKRFSDPGREVRLGWNGYIGLRNIFPVSPNGHFVYTSAPRWSWYSSAGKGKMFNTVFQVKKYMKKSRVSGIQRDLSPWLLLGQFRPCPQVHAPASY
jgi:hypothetical protein